MKWTLSFTTLALMLSPLGAFAAVYQYSDSSGTTWTVTSDTEDAARASLANMGHTNLKLINAPADVSTNPAAAMSNASSSDTGVGGSGNADVTITTGGMLFDYVDMNQVVQTVQATNASEALVTAPNIDPTSGVAPHTGVIDVGAAVTNQ